jgi:DNA polymerase-4
LENLVKKIIHVDMDAFYCSVEQLDNPELAGKPVVVGTEKDRGVIAAASYEARKFGIHSAMASVTAKRKCKNLIFIKPRMNRYKEISTKIRKIFYEFTDLVEPLSLDEAFLDVTNNETLATDIACQIRKRIKTEIGITSSAGISVNKFVAKIATEVNKPDGQKTIHPTNVNDFLDRLPIGKFFGVGKVTKKKMQDHGIYLGRDLRKLNRSYLVKNFGKSGKYFYNIIRSIDNNPVNPNRIRKSVGTEKTFSSDLSSVKDILFELNILANELEKRLFISKKKGKTITLKIKYYDFKQITISRTIEQYVNKKVDFFLIVKDLIIKASLIKPVRLLGISISNFKNFNIKQKKHQVDFNF